MTPRNIALVVGALALSVVVDLAVGVSTPGLYAAVGLGGCFAIVLVTKQVGKRLLLRPEGSRVGDPHPVGDELDEPDDVDPAATDPERIDRPDPDDDTDYRVTASGDPVGTDTHRYDAEPTEPDDGGDRA